MGFVNVVSADERFTNASLRNASHRMESIHILTLTGLSPSAPVIKITVRLRFLFRYVAGM